MLTVLSLLFAIPAVVLSSQDQAMCRVVVGDAFPAIQGLADKQGAKATVVAVPGGPKWMDTMMAGDLKDDFAPKYGEKGVALLSLGGPTLGDGVESMPVKTADLEGALGKGRGPRVYLLDKAGKVVWFDIEYTLSTHRELHAALDELVGQ